MSTLSVTPNAESSVQPWFNFQLDLVRCLWVVLPPALCWGASFPLALAAAATRKQDPGKLVGGVYAANTVGAILGSLLFSLVVIPRFGTQTAERWLIGLAVWPRPADACCRACGPTARMRQPARNPTALPSACAQFSSSPRAPAWVSWPGRWTKFPTA